MATLITNYGDAKITIVSTHVRDAGYFYGMYARPKDWNTFLYTGIIQRSMKVNSIAHALAMGGTADYRLKRLTDES